ncbi:MAG: hypothetical protein ABSD29_09375 [Verrucomicrobiota bacterium]|jgi:hypothetical protein
MRGIISNSRYLFLLLLVLAAGALGGCASTEPENLSERPWDTPQGWENGLPSSMYNQYR